MDHHHIVNCKDYSWKKRDYSCSSVLEFGSHEYSAVHLGHGKIFSPIKFFLRKNQRLLHRDGRIILEAEQEHNRGSPTGGSSVIRGSNMSEAIT